MSPVEEIARGLTRAQKRLVKAAAAMPDVRTRLSLHYSGDSMSNERGVGDWPTFEVEIDGFPDCYIEAPTKASARLWAATKCHEAGYGRSPMELIRRGITIREVSTATAIIMGGPHYRVERKRPSLPNPGHIGKD